jgi:chitin disaccharide deacetylase
MTVLSPHAPARAETRKEPSTALGALIINADDWGRDRITTDRTLDCVLRNSISSVSGMVFMEDSTRAANFAREHRVDTGLHLNFTSPFSGENCPSVLADHQRRISRYLLGHRFAQLFFHPLLQKSFEYVVRHQLDEFRRLYGSAPQRIDGHHHMHLCANVVMGKLLPARTIARRNFSFQAGEKSVANRLYRRVLDRKLARRHRLTDFLFNLEPMENAGRLDAIFSLSRKFVVELETHPASSNEFLFLTGGELFRRLGDLPISPCFVTHDQGPS